MKTTGQTIDALTEALPEPARSVVEAELVAEAADLVAGYQEEDAKRVAAGVAGLHALEMGNTVTVAEAQTRDQAFLSQLRGAASSV